MLSAWCDDLLALPEEVWSAYALSREPLRGGWTGRATGPTTTGPPPAAGRRPPGWPTPIPVPPSGTWPPPWG